MSDRDLARQLSEIWSRLWRIEDAPAPGITMAMPLRVVALEARPNREFPYLIARGPHAVTWIGSSREHGLVEATGIWHADGEDRGTPPMPPADGWMPCKAHQFRNALRPCLIENRMIGEFGSYAALPLPAPASRGAAALVRRVAIDGTLNVLETFAEKLALSDKAVRTMIPEILSGYPFTARFGAEQRPTQHLEDVLWILGNSTETDLPAHEVAKRREQALLAMPVFGCLVRQHDALTASIDRGEALVPAIAEHLRVSQALVRTMAAASKDLAGTDDLERMVKGFHRPGIRHVLDNMPPDRVRALLPTMNTAAWTSLKNLVHEHDYLSAETMIANIAPKLNADANGDWGWLREAKDVWIHLEDVVSEFADEILWPAEAGTDQNNPVEGGRPLRNLNTRDQVVSAALLLTLEPRKLARVLQDHMNGTLRRAAEVARTNELDAPEWRVPGEPVIANGRVLRFLSSTRELAHEGEQMQHCVIAYNEACLSGRSAILSIGDWQRDIWHPTSTVELNAGAGWSGDPVVGQHRGVGNSSPSEADTAALAEWTRRVARDSVPFDRTLLQDKAQAETISERLGENWRTPEAHEARWARWRRILDVRAKTAGEFAAAALPAVVFGNEPSVNQLHLKAVQLACRMLHDMDVEMDLERQVRALGSLSNPSP